MIYVLCIVVFGLLLVGMGVIDSVLYQRRLRESLVSPDPNNYAIEQINGFRVQYSSLVEPGTVLLIKGRSIWEPDLAVFSGNDDTPWMDQWQNYLERDED
jgi:hypothetical protein